MCPVEGGRPIRAGLLRAALLGAAALRVAALGAAVLRLTLIRAAILKAHGMRQPGAGRLIGSLLPLRRHQLEVMGAQVVLLLRDRVDLRDPAELRVGEAIAERVPKDDVVALLGVVADLRDGPVVDGDDRSSLTRVDVEPST